MKILLIGGTGTIGKAYIKMFYKKHEIIIFSRDELKQAELKAQYPKLKFVIGDIKDPESLNNITYKVDAIILAAALKRIEFCQSFPIEAIKTNVIGTNNVLTYAKQNKIKNLVFLSTDKAVNPVNIYGMSKHIAETLVIQAGYNCVRYGNVFNSRGSVIPIFQYFNSLNKSLPISNKAMTRFLISQEEALKIIEYALNSKEKNTIFVKKLKAIPIIELAHYFSNKTKEIGAYPYEKIHEDLLSAREKIFSTQKNGYYYVKPCCNRRVKINANSNNFDSSVAKNFSDKEIKSMINYFKDI